MCIYDREIPVDGAPGENVGREEKMLAGPSSHHLFFAKIQRRIKPDVAGLLGHKTRIR
jgi:hypothetical protein